MKTKTEEFHGVSVFNVNIDVSVTGTWSTPDAYIVFDNAQIGGSQAAAPNQYGLKLRVECSTAYPHTAKLVALAGTSNNETPLADDIGGSVRGC